MIKVTQLRAECALAHNTNGLFIVFILGGSFSVNGYGKLVAAARCEKVKGLLSGVDWAQSLMLSRFLPFLQLIKGYLPKSLDLAALYLFFAGPQGIIASFDLIEFSQLRAPSPELFEVQLLTF